MLTLLASDASVATLAEIEVQPFVASYGWQWELNASSVGDE